MVDFVDDFDRLKEIWSINIRNEIYMNFKQSLYLCIIWILKNVNREILKKYISLEVVSKVLSFIDLLSVSMDVFSISSELALGNAPC